MGFFKTCVFTTKVPAKISPGKKSLTGNEILVNIPIKSNEMNFDQCATALGRIVQCSYSITITTNFGSCITREVSFDAHVVILPKIVEIVVPSAPEDWNPVEMPSRRMSVISNQNGSVRQLSPDSRN